MSETFKERINKAIKKYMQVEPLTEQEIKEMEGLLLIRN